MTVPERGEKRRLVGLATQNAVEALERERTEWMADAARRDEASSSWPPRSTSRPPERIECYDMSNIQGTSAVGSMVVFIDGKPEPREYRRFRIRSGETPDDFRMMAEVLRRRFSRRRAAAERNGRALPRRCGADEAPEGEREDGELLDLEPNAGPIDDESAARARREAAWTVPSLVIVDGGGSCPRRSAHCPSSITDVPLSGLAKRFEELYVPDRAAPDRAAAPLSGAVLVQRIRDEAHRFAITYHRDVRGKRALRSELDDVAGIGPGRKRALPRFDRFGGSGRRPSTMSRPPPGISRDLAER